MPLMVCSQNQTVISVPSKGCPTPIVTPVVTTDRIFNYVLESDKEDGSDWYVYNYLDPTWGNFSTLALVDGKYLEMGFDINSLTHCVIVDGEVEVSDIGLHYESHDPGKNTVTFSRGLNETTIDFDDSDAIVRLKAFCSAPIGWTRESYVYCMTPVDPSLASCGKRRVLAADLPQEASRRKKILNVLEEILPSYVWKDTLYLIDKPMDTLKDLVEKQAEGEFVNAYMPYRSAPSDTLFTPYGAENDVVSVDFVWESPEYLTMLMTHNSTYTAGGGFCFGDNVYVTFDKKRGKRLMLADLIDPDMRDRFMNDLVDAIYYDLNDNDEESWSRDEIDSGIREGIDSGINDVDIPLSVAVTDKYLIIGYPGECLTQFGETGNWYVKFPVSVLETCNHP